MVLSWRQADTVSYPNTTKKCIKNQRNGIISISSIIMITDCSLAMVIWLKQNLSCGTGTTRCFLCGCTMWLMKAAAVTLRIAWSGGTETKVAASCESSTMGRYSHEPLGCTLSYNCPTTTGILRHSFWISLLHKCLDLYNVKCIQHLPAVLGEAFRLQL